MACPPAPRLEAFLCPFPKSHGDSPALDGWRSRGVQEAQGVRITPWNQPCFFSDVGHFSAWQVIRISSRERPHSIDCAPPSRSPVLESLGDKLADFLVYSFPDSHTQPGLGTADLNETCPFNAGVPGQGRWPAKQEPRLAPLRQTGLFSRTSCWMPCPKPSCLPQSQLPAQPL